MKENQSVVPTGIEKPVAFTKNAKWIAETEARGEALFANATALVIATDTDRIMAADIREESRQLGQAVDKKFAEPLVTAKAIYEFVRDGVNRMKFNTKRAMEISEQKMSDYDLMRKREAAAAKAKAEQEKEEQDRKDRERLLAQAAKAEEKGKDEKAELLRERAEQVNNFIPYDPGPEKQIRTEAGTTSGREDYDLYITDVMTVLRQIVDGKIPYGVLALKKETKGIVEIKITAAAIKRHAEMSRMSDALPIIPGCFLDPKMSYSGRAASK